MSTKAPLSQTGDTAPSTSSTTSTLENHDTIGRDLQNNQVMKEKPESPDSGIDEAFDEEAPERSIPGGFTLLMTVTALAMSMFLVSLDMVSSFIDISTYCISSLIDHKGFVDHGYDTP